MNRFIVRGACICAFALLATACASPPKVKGELRYALGEDSRRASALFPPPPDTPRIAYVGELIGDRNFVRDEDRKTFSNRLLEFLTGESDNEVALELQRPQSITGDSQGRIYVSDAGLGGVFVFDRVAGEVRLYQRSDASDRFVSPSGMAVLPDGSLVVADAGGGFIAHLNADGSVRPPIGKGVLKRPVGVVFDESQKRIIVADAAESTLRVFDLEGRLVSSIGRPGAENAEFNRPTYLAIWKNELYVSDSFNARIQVLDLDTGAFIRQVGSRGVYVGQLSIPKGIAVDSEGNLYVVESQNDHLLIYDRSGRFLLPISGTGRANGGFYLPAGIWIDTGNRIHVADMFNARVVAFLYLGSEAESTE